jgi:riboflavin synthase alpha subunit
VCDVNRADNTFTFMLIPYTQKHIIVPKKEVGRR